MPTNEELLKRIEDLEKKINYPIDFNFQKTLEKSQFDEMNIKTLKGGLPVYTTARTTDLKNGEIWVEYDLATEATTLKIYVSVEGGTAGIHSETI